MSSTLQTHWHLLHFLHRHELARSLHKASERSAGLKSQIYKGQQAMLAECRYQGDHQRHPWWTFCLTQSGHKPRQSHCSHTWHCARCGERHRRRAGVAYWSCHRYDRMWKLSVAHLLAWDCTLGHCCWSDPPRRKTFCRLRSPFPAMACSGPRLGRVLSDPLLHHCSRCTASQIISPFALSLFCCCCCRSALTFPPCSLLALHGSFLSQSHSSSKTPASHSRNFFFLCRNNAETFHLLALHGSYLSQSHPSSKAPNLHSRNLFFLCQKNAATSPLLALHGSFLSQSHPSSQTPASHSRNLFFLCQMHAATFHLLALHGSLLS